jgi:hypothetical protein
MDFDYTAERHLALMLIARDRIAMRDLVPVRADGLELPPDVFAALVGLERQELLSPNRTPHANAVVPVELTVAGVHMLAQFNRDHGRPPGELVAACGSSAVHGAQQ